MKNKLILIIAVFIVISIVVFSQSYKKVPQHASVVMINDLVIEVEVADTPQRQAQGLSNRDSLLAHQGMLFPYDDYQIRTFWMNKMRFPIDIIWIKDNQIVGIEKNVPIPQGSDIPTFSSPGPINYVLEVNAGFAQKYGIKTGDGVIIKL